MDFGLSPDQVLLQDTLTRMLAEQAPLERVRRYAEQNEDRAGDVWDATVELGLSGLVIEEAYGGAGLGLVEAALAAETLGAHVAPVPFIATGVVVPLALQEGGSEAQRDRWLPRLTSGACIAGLALSEHSGAREDARITSEQDRLSGRALFTLDHAADAYLVADTAGALYLVEAHAAGLTRIDLTTVDRSRRTGELCFDNTPAERLAGSDAALTRRCLDRARVLLAADTLGAAQHMLNAAVDYAKQREQFGRVIGSFQAVKHMCAEMAAALEPCRAMVWYAAYALEALPDEAHLTACHTKAHLSEVGKSVARTATEVHGGMGFTDLLGLHYWFKRIGLNRQLLGSPERLRHEAALAQGLVDGIGET
ncbi:MAG: acyl-CoA dehydrogenase family protein [Gammaproteobacteria bacterium]